MDNIQRKNNKRSKIKIQRSVVMLNAAAFLFPIAGILILFFWQGYAPFGGLSLACQDAEVQYLDFFAWLKDVLLGKNCIAYSFSKLLGGNSIGLYSYYLASPLNILVLFFDKSEMNSLFDLLVVLKLAFASFFSYLFLQHRFADAFQQSIQKKLFFLMLAWSYALGQYSIAQSSNIMWLDGVVLLPLIQLGVYNLVHKKNGLLLSCSVGFSILFNWYTGGMNVLFACGWFLMEAGLVWIGHERVYGHSLVLTMRFAGAMLEGLLLSAVLFFPTVLAMRTSGEGELFLNGLRDLSFISKVPSLLESYTLGAKSGPDTVSLFCGGFVLLGVLGVFCEKRIPWKKRLVFGVAGCAVLMMFCWNPLYLLFSLLKPFSSYYCRFSYLGISFLIFLAGYYYALAGINPEGKIFKAVLGYVCVYLLIDFFHGTQETLKIYMTAVLLLIEASLFTLLKMRSEIPVKKSRFNLAVLMFVVMAELLYSAKLQLKNYHFAQVDSYAQYAQQEEAQIESIKNTDPDVFRISQTSTRNMQSSRLTAYYNDSLAYNYRGITGYSSTPDACSISFLEKVGYRCEADDIAIVNDAILPADSLMGVKYYLAERDIPGTIKTEESLANGKAVYQNPYYLPLAFSYVPQKDQDEPYVNPFQFLNHLYSELLQEPVNLFLPLNYEKSTDITSLQIDYQIPLQDGNCSYYGNIPWNSAFAADLYCNKNFLTGYARWLSPSVFAIPAETTKTVTLTVQGLDSAIGLDICSGKEQFYALDLDVMDHAAQNLRAKAAKIQKFENGYISLSISAKEGENLFVSVPLDKGWRVTVNGKTTLPETFASCFLSIPLEDGENEILLKYTVPGSIPGIICTFCAVLLLSAGIVVRKKTANQNY